ncbi:TPA: lysine transporter LysE [Pseudomonas aeruginosa]|uniref:Lysine transporter LysE n=1 Tax=Pseudomonas aeruginosa TaxID=287 RepID=A0ABD7K562_PSEAI|nr:MULTISPECIES: LysE family transporter [Pseudomonas aeruginosa group]AYZ85834.1 lysine transporter LysE [Pseudomonas aeruginosa]EKS2404878.1 LysE family transporter [Pseudomonas aeruginosa]EKW2495616.1 LysE family transporter [Pseudomonas aeruginosa]EKW4463046.1 LysE family transporter [Pseudomonas aeruginosa]EKX1100743.1 LysE family transporter [Pseudomonas aeruginosa]
MDVTTFLGLALLPILSPGPSSILVVRNSLRHGLSFASRRLLTDLAGTVLSASFLLYGLGSLINGSKPLLVGIQLAGAGYVLLAGLLCLQRMRRPPTDAFRVSRSAGGLWLESFLAGLLNPKTLVFFALLQPLLAGAEERAAPLAYALGYSLYKGCVLTLTCAVFLLARDWCRRRLRLANGILGTALVAAGSGFLVKLSAGF